MRAKSSKAKQSKQRKAQYDPFAVFMRSTTAAFSFLVHDYDCEKVSTSIHPPECEIKYRNDTTGVTITYEWGGVVWLDLSRLTRNSEEAVEEERYSLDVLMLECLPSMDINCLRPSESESPDDYVERVLEEYARILNDCGDAILHGDFRIFPKLRKHAEEVLRQRNKEMFG
jgi:hypothetical protein